MSSTIVDAAKQQRNAKRPTLRNRTTNEHTNTSTTYTKQPNHLRAAVFVVVVFAKAQRKIARCLRAHQQK